MMRRQRHRRRPFEMHKQRRHCITEGSCTTRTERMQWSNGLERQSRRRTTRSLQKTCARSPRALWWMNNHVLLPQRRSWRSAPVRRHPTTSWTRTISTTRCRSSSHSVLQHHGAPERRRSSECYSTTSRTPSTRSTSSAQPQPSTTSTTFSTLRLNNTTPTRSRTSTRVSTSTPSKQRRSSARTLASTTSLSCSTTFSVMPTETRQSTWSTRVGATSASPASSCPRSPTACSRQPSAKTPTSHFLPGKGKLASRHCTTTRPCPCPSSSSPTGRM